MGQYPAIANFMHNVYDRVFYDPLQGHITQAKLNNPRDVGGRMRFAADIPKLRDWNPKAMAMLETPEYREAYKARWRSAHDAPLYFKNREAKWNNVAHETKVRTLSGTTHNSGVQGLVRETFFDVVSQRIN